MNAILEALMGAVGTAGYALDTPGALLRGALAGRPGTRASGREMLEDWGAIGGNENQGWIPDMGDIAGFAAENLLDPMNLIGAGAVKSLVGKLRGVKAHNATRAADLARGFMPEELIKDLHPAMQTRTLAPTAGMEPGLAKMIRDSELQYGDLPERVAENIRTMPDPDLIREYMGHISESGLPIDEIGKDAAFPWFDEARKMGLFEDTIKPRTYHHGTQYEFGHNEYDMAKMDPTGLKGPGIYTTDSAPVASGYSMTKPEAPVHRFYSEAPGSKEAWNNAMVVANTDPSLTYTPQAPGTIPRDILEDLGSAFKDDEDSHDTLLEYVHDIFKKAGYPEGAKGHLLNEDVVLRPAHVKKHFVDIQRPFNAEFKGGDRLTLDQLKKVLVEPDIEDILRVAAEQRVDPSEGFRLMNKPKPGFWNPDRPRAVEEWHGQIPKTDNLMWTKRGTDEEGVEPATFGELLSALGYDGIVHRGQGGVGFGGLGTGGYGEHQVAIALNNNQMYLPYIAAAAKDNPDAGKLIAALLGHNAATNTQRTFLRDMERG